MLVAARVGENGVEALERVAEEPAHPAAATHREQQRVDGAEALRDRRQRETAAGVGRRDFPEHLAASRATDLRVTVELPDRRRWIRLDHLGPRKAPEAEWAPDPNATAMVGRLVNLDEPLLEEPVIAQVGEELEDTLRWMRDPAGRADRAAYQPLVSSSSSGRSAAAERPLMASPRPCETRARISGSL
jgi:hypothetical protein